MRRGALVVAPIFYLLVDSLYAVRGWDDADTGALHVLAAIVYGVALFRIVEWAGGWLRAALLAAVVAGTVGNAAYGFNTINAALGGLDLVDTSGPGAIIKPLGPLFPLALLLSAAVLHRLGARLPTLLVAAAGIGWPIAHIANIGLLAVAVNLLLVLGLVPLARPSVLTGSPVDG
jgi:hypothetical protein